MDTSAAFDRLTRKAIANAEDILDVELVQDPETMDFPPAILRAKTAIYTSTISTKAKVEEASLRRQAEDRLPELLQLLREMAKTVPSGPLIEG